MLSKGRMDWAERWFPWFGNSAPGKLVVSTSAEVARYDNSPCLRVDADEAEIEEDVHVGSYQEAVGRVVCLNPAVRRNMCCFKYFGK